MSIATKTGDSGETSLWSGERVGKDDARVEAYGSLDELSSFLGLARHSCRLESSIAAIESIQRGLVRAEAELASSHAAGKARSRIGPEDEAALSGALHALEARIKLKGFVLPGMTEGSAALDLARTVCRRAERRIVALSRESPVSAELLKYVNRLSDYLFMLARDEEEAEGRITYA
jgi:ATP:cob(I)alamin adenosyltransferase